MTDWSKGFWYDVFKKLCEKYDAMDYLEGYTLMNIFYLDKGPYQGWSKNIRVINTL